MEPEGFDETDFILELELYDIVRPSTWQSWNSLPQTPQRSTAPEPQTRTNTSKKVSAPTLNPADGFWMNMTTYMLSHYDADDVENMLDIVQAEMDSKMESLSLDELERIAGSMIAPGP